MTEPFLAPFNWVYKLDGRLVPFEADKISRALFGAAESLGRPDAFLARELTDGILHFLASEADGTILTTAQIADMVVKVVRELGQPALAQAFQEGRMTKAASNRETAESHAGVVRAEEESRSFPANVLASWLPSEEQMARWVEEAPAPVPLAWRASGAYLSRYSLQQVFARDLVAAHADGLLTLANLEAPFELTGWVLGSLREQKHGVFEAIEEARSIAGAYVAIDGLEHSLSHARVENKELTIFARELQMGLRSTGLRAVVNLNSARPPLWAEHPAEGPLFVEHHPPPDPQCLTETADALLDEFLAPQRSATASVEQRTTNNEQRTTEVRIDWHLGAGDFLPEKAGRLFRLARRAVESETLAFVFDRPGRSVCLAEGLDRQHAAVLLTVGLNLPRLAEQPGLRHNPSLFLQKLGSLVRLALSAAVQKRNFLRRQSQARPAVTRGFLLNRARLVVAPVGLETTIRTLTGQPIGAGGAGLELARQVVQRLGESLREDGPTCHLDTCLDAPADFALVGWGEGGLKRGKTESLGASPLSDIAGITPWDAQAPAHHQLRTAGVLHAAAGTGTAAVLVPGERPLAAEEVVELLRYAWQQTELVRLRFLRIAPPRRQLTAPWDE